MKGMGESEIKEREMGRWVGSRGIKKVGLRKYFGIFGLFAFLVQIMDLGPA